VAPASATDEPWRRRETKPIERFEWEEKPSPLRAIRRAAPGDVDEGNGAVALMPADSPAFSPDSNEIAVP